MIAEVISRYISERLLKQLWKKQEFISLPLRTLDGKEIKVISIGSGNPDGGPDFLDACITIGGTKFAGDVELHRSLSDWSQHEHQKDPKYNKVILHVVFYADKKSSAALTKSRREVPTLILEPYLSKELLELLHNIVFDEKGESVQRISCVSSNQDVSKEILLNWLNKLSIERLEFKVRRFEERLKELVNREKAIITEPSTYYGRMREEINPEEMPDFSPHYTQSDFTDIHLWEQMLYEFIMEALGYSKNPKPFLRLARSATLKTIKNLTGESGGIAEYEAILFGASGLIPTNEGVDDEESKIYLKQINKTWKTLSNNYKDEKLNGSEWQFFRLRPKNFPTVRLASAVTIIERIIQNELFKTIIHIVKDEDLPNDDKIKNLFSLIVVESTGFWKHHYRFGQKSAKPINMLIGKDKAAEIIINTIIPLCLLYARIFKKKEIRKNVLDLFSEIKIVKRSSLIDSIDEQLIRGKFKINTASLYQGAVQLYKFYCQENRCRDCEMGKKKTEVN